MPIPSENPAYEEKACRKAFHFDLDEELLKKNYPSESETGYKAAWGKVCSFMTGHGFEHAQYSGYESINPMTTSEAFSLFAALNKKYDWFWRSAKAATITDIGASHDVLKGYKRSLGAPLGEALSGPVPCGREGAIESPQGPPRQLADAAKAAAGTWGGRQGAGAPEKPRPHKT